MGVRFPKSHAGGHIDDDHLPVPPQDGLQVLFFKRKTRRADLNVDLRIGKGYELLRCRFVRLGAGPFRDHDMDGRVFPRHPLDKTGLGENADGDPDVRGGRNRPAADSR